MARHERRGHDHGQPEERTAQQVERVGIDKPAAQVGGPAERPAVFDKGVGVLVKVDLLVVEVPRVVEVPAARDASTMQWGANSSTAVKKQSAKTRQ